MKRILLTVVLIFALSASIKSNAEVIEPDLHMMHATAYIGSSDTTYAGTHVREGIAATNKSHLGQTAIVYQRLPGNKVGKVIGIYEIEDTGKTEGIINDTVIDIWNPDMDSCKDFMKRVYEDGCQGKVFVQFLEAEG